MLSQRFEEALVYAARLHAAQPRKISGVPYLSHLLGVASIALEFGADEDEAIAALLHDAVEDQGGAATREEIRRRFADRVTAIVDGCTDTEITPKPPWPDRKLAYIAGLEASDASVRLVSAADKLHNVRTIITAYRERGEEIWPCFQGKRAGTLWYYRALVDAYRRFEPHPLVDELACAVAELERIADKGSQPAG